jgi:bifunctional dethiobiotin synthetase / adenosylmethionine---8-amino-7-oxononanoate aminotransferase
MDSASEDKQSMAQYYESVSKLDAVDELVSLSFERHDARVEGLKTMASRAYERIWYPFTQHQHISTATILPIDSAYGDFFQSYNSSSETSVCGDGSVDAANLSNTPCLLQPTFDGSASWWTQGLGHGNPDLSLTAAYAAGRYGHVMFAGAIHEPALSLAELLVQNLNNPRLQRVFYSDNGSTGMEIAVKMALGSACKRYGWIDTSDDVGILGLKASYHGDTIGAMDCSEPSIYNQKVGWYRGRGYWIDYPQVKMQKGVWIVEPPEGMESELGPRTTFESLDEVFNISRREDDNHSRLYRAYIKNTLERLVGEGKKFGALMMEPVLLGAGGMAFM